MGHTVKSVISKFTKVVKQLEAIVKREEERQVTLIDEKDEIMHDITLSTNEMLRAERIAKKLRALFEEEE